jgi:hypothetical protein
MRSALYEFICRQFQECGRCLRGWESDSRLRMRVIVRDIDDQKERNDAKPKTNGRMSIEHFRFDSRSRMRALTCIYSRFTIHRRS